MTREQAGAIEKEFMSLAPGMYYYSVSLLKTKYVYLHASADAARVNFNPLATLCIERLGTHFKCTFDLHPETLQTSLTFNQNFPRALAAVYSIGDRLRNHFILDPQHPDMIIRIDVTAYKHGLNQIAEIQKISPEINGRLLERQLIHGYNRAKVALDHYIENQKLTNNELQRGGTPA